MDEIFKSHDYVNSSATKKSRQSRFLDARIDLLKDELDSIKWKKSTGCNMKVMRRKSANANGKLNSLVDDLRRDIYYLYARLRHSVDQSSLAVGSHLRETTVCQAKGLQ